LTRKDTPRDKRLFQPLEPWTPDKEDMWDLDIEESPQPNAATPLSFSRGEKSVPARSGSEMDVLLPCKEEPELSCQMEDLPFMSTTEMYLCCWNQPPLSPLRETSPKKEEEVARYAGVKYLSFFYVKRSLNSSLKAMQPHYSCCE
ncbi:hypothetical protein XENOCAPTIV_028566, partial [Xenoophorus captivus]